MKTVMALLLTLVTASAALTIENRGSCIALIVAPAPWYCALEWSNTLESNSWNHYRTTFSNPGEPVSERLTVLVSTNQQRMFWRLRETPLP